MAEGELAPPIAARRARLGAWSRGPDSAPRPACVSGARGPCRSRARGPVPAGSALTAAAEPGGAAGAARSAQRHLAAAGGWAGASRGASPFIPSLGMRGASSSPPALARAGPCLFSSRAPPAEYGRLCALGAFYFSWCLGFAGWRWDAGPFFVAGADLGASDRGSRAADLLPRDFSRP